MRVDRARRSVRDLALNARITEAPLTEAHGDCTAPIEQHQFGYPDKIAVGLGIEADTIVTQKVTRRCRKCEACLHQRKALWTARAIAETKVSSRTWFGTLTLRPDWATRARMAAHAKLQRRVSDMTEANQFRESVNFMGPEISRYFSRLRKTASFRYLLVSEAHKSGHPHWHLLLHEKGQPISKAELERQWIHGFSHWRLVDIFDAKAAGYVCKYLSKSLATRVRGSRHYGSPDLDDFTERIEQATQLIREPLANLTSTGPPPPVPGGKNN